MKIDSITSANGSKFKIMPAEYKNNISMQAVLSDIGLGTVKLQGSDEDVPLNWHDVQSGGLTLGGVGSYATSLIQICYKFIRVLFTDSLVRVATIQCVGDQAGSLAGSFVKIQCSPTGVPYLFWFKVSGVGSAPNLPGFTQVEVDISNNASAATIASTIAIANPASADFVITNPSPGQLVFTQKVGGKSVLLLDGDVPTGFNLNDGNPPEGGLNVYIQSQDFR